jgi:hypothetical protein
MNLTLTLGILQTFVKELIFLNLLPLPEAQAPIVNRLVHSQQARLSQLLKHLKHTPGFGSVN